MANLKQTIINGDLTVNQTLNLEQFEVNNIDRVNFLSQKSTVVIGETATNINFFDSNNTKSLLTIPGLQGTTGPEIRFYADTTQTSSDTRIGHLSFKNDYGSSMSDRFGIGFYYIDSSNASIKFKQSAAVEYEAINFGETYDNTKCISFGGDVETTDLTFFNTSLIYKNNYNLRIGIEREKVYQDSTYQSSDVGAFGPFNSSFTFTWDPIIEPTKTFTDVASTHQGVGTWYRVLVTNLNPVVNPPSDSILYIPGSLYSNKTSGFGTASGRLYVYQQTNDKESGLKFIASSYLSPAAIGTMCIYYSPNDRLNFSHCAFQNANNNYYSTSPTETLMGYITKDVTTSVNVVNFTGQHRVLKSNNLVWHDENIGKIVVSSGEYSNFDSTNSISINESLPKVLLSNKREQKNVIGVISSEKEEDVRTLAMGAFVSYWPFEFEQKERIIINSIGEGCIWITNINGSLENGDYITTCEIPGYGMKQDEDILHNYTVAKITCDCDFDLQSTIYICKEFEWKGQIYRKAFVGCTYHCG